MKCIIGLTGVTYDECTKTYCLVHPYVNHIDVRDIPDNEMTISKVQNYIGCILRVAFV